MTVQWPFAMRELPKNTRIRRHLAAVMLTIGVFSWLGPFGTGSRLAPGELVAYWTAAIAGNWAIAMTTVPFTIRLFMQTGRPTWAGIATGALIAALPGTGLVWLLEYWTADALVSAAMLAWLYASVAIVFLVLAFLAWHLVELPLRARAERSAGPQAGEPAVPPPFLSRLPARLGEELLHLRMQDHYVEASTTTGSELILLRFRDALREVEGLDGMQVHRSHWVARAAVARPVRRSGRVILELVNGAEVPVSRSFVPALKERGWL